MESQGWRAAAQLDVVEAGPLPCIACVVVDAGSRFPCLIVSYRVHNALVPPPSPAGAAAAARPRPAPRAPACPPPRALAATLAFTTHIDAIQYTAHNSSKFGAGAQTAAPGSRSTVFYTRPTRPRHRHRRVGVHAPRHERQHRRRRALGIVGFFGCGGGGVIAGGNARGNGDMGTGGTGTGYGARGGASASAAATGAVV